VESGKENDPLLPIHVLHLVMLYTR